MGKYQTYQCVVLIFMLTLYCCASSKSICFILPVFPPCIQITWQKKYKVFRSENKLTVFRAEEFCNIFLPRRHTTMEETTPTCEGETGFINGLLALKRPLGVVGENTPSIHHLKSTLTAIKLPPEL